MGFLVPSLAEFLMCLSDKIDKDATKDYNGKRTQLAHKLWGVAASIATLLLLWTITGPMSRLSESRLSADIALQET